MLFLNDLISFALCGPLEGACLPQFENSGLK